MTPLENIIRSRKSTYPKDFIPSKISQADLESILSVTPYAPNHRNTRPWRYFVFTENAKDSLANKLFDLYQETTDADKFLEKKQLSFKEKVDQSAAVICIVHNVSQTVPEWEERAAIAMSVQNLWLRATELGYGGYWSTTGLARHLDEFLDLDENQNCIGLFFLGKIDKNEEVRDYDWKEYVSFKN